MSEATEPSRGSPEETRAELQALAARVSALEQTLQQVLAASIQPSAATGYARSFPSAARGQATSPAGAGVAQPPIQGASQSASKPQTLESRIGSSLLNRIGVLGVIIGMGLFFKLAIDRNLVSPPLRIAIGLGIAVGLVVWSESFRRRRFAAFSYSLKALGTAIAYLALWAAYSVYGLIGAGIAFAAMVVITVVNAGMAWLQDSELLAAYALMGGLATPALLSTGQNHELFLFSYLLLLDVGALILSAHRPWNRLVLGAFTGTVVYYGLWYQTYFSADAFALTGMFLLLFFLAFTVAPLLGLRLIAVGRETDAAAPPAVDNPLSDLVVIGLPVVVHTSTFLAAWAWTRGAHRTSLRPWIALGLAASSLAVDLVVRSIDGRSVRGAPVHPARRASDHLADVHFGLGIFFLAVAAWVQFDRHSLSLAQLTGCWLVEALVLAAVVTLAPPHHHHPATAADHVTSPRVYATLMLLAATVTLLLLEYLDPAPYFTRPVLNGHFLTYLFGLVVLAVTAWLCARASAAHESDSKVLQPGVKAGGWRERAVEPGSLVFLAGFAAIAFNLVALIAGSVQIHLYWMRDDLQQSALRLPPAGTHTVGFSYSVWFMVYGAVLMAIGFLRRSELLRWQALVLLALAVGKVFVVDASRLSQGYRVMSFLGLGVLLLAISFAYQRDWLALRGRE
ncbi:MAG TPA: DUF2339 domain-containing protein [Acidisarcina sp.]